MLNEVFLAGTIQGELRPMRLRESEERFVFRLKVSRDQGGSDSVNCVVEDGSLLKFFNRSCNNQTVSVAGRIQSRFFRSGSGVASVLEVLVQDIKKVD